jgi:acyl transferase domain-containing protein
VSAFGFGGSNFHCVLEEYRPRKVEADWEGDVQILAFSAPDTKGLAALLDAVPQTASWTSVRAHAAATRAAFSCSDQCRLLLVAERQKGNLSSLVRSARTMIDTDTRPSWSTPDGAFFASGARSGSIAALFPGQGSQYVRMLRDLACHFPEMLEALQAADEAYAGDARLTDLIYPHPLFTEKGKAAAEEALRDTRAAQPGIGAVSMGAYRILSTFGLAPDAAAGHSYGELTALWAAGRLTDDEIHRLSGVRGRLMAEGDGGRGAMLAVAAPLPVIEEVLAAEGLDLVLANRNAPDQGVLSGTAEEIGRTAAILSSRGIACKPLPVSAAFHSPLVAGARDPFLAAMSVV